MCGCGEEQGAGGRRAPRLWLLLAALATGTLVFLAFPEWDLTALAWLALVPLRLALARWGVRGRAALGWGLVAGLVANLGGFFWIVHLLRVFGHLPAAVAVALLLLLASYQGLVFALWGWGTTELASRLPRGWWPLADALTFTAAEICVPFIFPWYFGCSQYRFLPLAQLVELTGVPGISFVLVLAGGTLALLLHTLLQPRCGAAAAAGAGESGQRPHRMPRLDRGPLRCGAAVALLVLAVLTWGELRRTEVAEQMARAPRLRLALVEGDIGIRQKGRAGHTANNLAIYQRLSSWAARRGAQLVVWPESAYDVQWIYEGTRVLPPTTAPLPPDERWERLLGPLDTDHLVLPGMADLPPATDPEWEAKQHVSRRDRLAPQRGFAVPLLFGAVTWEPEDHPPAAGRRWQRRHFNSALLLGADGRVDGRIYRKNKLLVFGEYIPLGRSFPWLYDLLPEASSFTPGSEVRVFSLPLEPAASRRKPDRSAAPSPRAGAQAAVRLGMMICYEAILPRFAGRFGEPFPDLLVTLTNDAWFGTHGEPWLHLALTVFRAIEHRVPLVRSTNTGISAVVDPTGRIAAHTSVEHAEVLVQDVPILRGGRSAYRLVGDLFSGLVLAACAGLVLAAAVPTRQRKVQRKSCTPS